MNPSYLDTLPLDRVGDMEKAFDTLDPLETKHYRQAVHEVPALVEKETPFSTYLRATRGSALEAARRIAKFWKFRWELFGPDRWLLPMVQTGIGALNQMEIDFIQSGFVMMVERENSGLVIVVDFSRAMELFAKARALQMDTLAMFERIGMYFCVTFTHEFSKGDVTLFHPITSRKRPEMEFRTRLWHMLHTSYPANLSDVVVAQSCEAGKKELLDFLRFQSANVLQMATGVTPKQICADTADQTVALLEMNGIPRNVTPIELGGDYDYDTKVSEWVRTRLRIESSLKPPPPPIDPLAVSPHAVSEIELEPTDFFKLYMEPEPCMEQCHRNNLQHVSQEMGITGMNAKNSAHAVEAVVTAPKRVDPEQWLPPPPHLIAHTHQVLEALDKFETREYMEAKEIVPGLVQKETPIECFLKVVQNDTLAAARRIAKFWKLRKCLFSERWLLPMTQTGGGALTDMDISFVQTGFAHVIPRRNTGPIILIDYSKAAKVFAKARSVQADTISLMEKIGMYLSVAFLEDFSRGPSVLMHPVTSKERPELEIRNRFWDMVQTAFPGYLKEVVVVQATEEGKKELLDFMGYHTTRVLRFSTQIEPYHVRADSVSKVMSELEGFAIHRDMVPIDLGGYYDMDSQVARWTRSRLTIESMIGPISPAPSTSIFKPKGRCLLLDRKEGKSEEEHRRERNRLYVRRNYMKRQMELASFEGQKEQLEAQNRVLKQQNEELTRALETVQKMVEQYHSGLLM